MYNAFSYFQIIPLSPSLTESKSSSPSLRYMSLFTIHFQKLCAQGKFIGFLQPTPMMFIEAPELEPLHSELIYSMCQESPSTLLRKCNFSLFKIILEFRGKP